MILDGKTVAQQIKNSVKDYISEHNADVTLTIVQVEGNPASDIYVRNKIKACAEVGIKSNVIKLPANEETRDSKLAETLKNCKSDGIMLQLPLPKGWDEDYYINLIPEDRDADCLTYKNLGRFYTSKTPYLSPCTVAGIMHLFNAYNIELNGKNATVIGRSNIVGRPLAHALEAADATVTLCHSKTANLRSHLKDADVIISAVGKPNFITSEMIDNKNAVIIDVGINRDAAGKLCGDVDFESLKDNCYAITPVPGGVGPLTVACLLLNTLKLHMKERPNG